MAVETDIHTAKMVEQISFFVAIPFVCHLVPFGMESGFIKIIELDLCKIKKTIVRIEYRSF